MKIKSEIIYTDTIYYYKKPVPGYICSILSANDPDGKNLNILERDSELELEYILEPNTTMSDIRNAICEKMNKQIGDLCRSCPCICIKSHEDFIEIENMDIMVETMSISFLQLLHPTIATAPRITPEVIHSSNGFVVPVTST